MNNPDHKLSIAIITKNEETFLPACLATLSFADEIIVVDSGSTDKTVEIAESAGCRVIVEAWKGYGPQKNSAVDKCSHQWVLVVDADERVPPDTRKVIKRILQSPKADAYGFKRKNFLHGQWMRHSGYWPDRQTRLVDRGRGEFHGAIHEQWITNGRLIELDSPIEHYSFAGYAEMLETLNSFSSACAKELFDSGKKATCLAPVVHGIGMFFKIFFLKKGFLDGFDGLVTAVTKAGGAFFKYAKLLELQNEKQ